ncbi:regulatory protein RecX [uncultured Mesonia sp.]|uniref:regulatory protein RecX n=1 Tax=uncultured Mesonia sp. TaxID=399731 RepID=UPI00374EB8B1
MKKKSFTVEEAKIKLMRYCAYQERCHQEVNKKLDELHIIPLAKEHIIVELIQQDFLNEERFAKIFTISKFNQKNWGKKRIINELKRREISAINIKTSLNQIDESEYLAKLSHLVEKKWNATSESNLANKKKKVMNYFLYRGWESHLVYEQIQNQANIK